MYTDSDEYPEYIQLSNEYLAFQAFFSYWFALILNI